MDSKNIDFWKKKYVNDETGWDIGAISDPLKSYIDQLKGKELNILIPGAGNSYEAEYLHINGFENVVVLDWAKTALSNIKNRILGFMDSNLISEDFFEHNSSYDLIIEQTFFCAINPALREKYVEKIHSLLKPNGKLVGLLFNIPLFENYQPFGGNKTEYLPLFEKKFKVKTMEVAYNSIKSRKNNELFIILEKN